MTAGIVLTAVTLVSQTPSGDPVIREDLIRSIYRQLIEIDTTDSTGDTTRAAEAMAQRLREAGFPESDIHVAGPQANKHNLVARYRGTGAARPILLLAHLDVVEARREDWSFDPFTLLEKDGYFYGRGTADDKGMAAIWVEMFIRLKKEGYRPNRDLILALTADEETGEFNGVDWLLKNHRDFIDAEFCINEGGNGQLRDGRALLLSVQLSEKVYQSFILEVTNRGGHSSRPRADNAIYILAEGLTRLEKHVFPAHLDEVTKAYYRASAPLYTGQVAEDMVAISRDRPNRASIKRLSATAFDNALLRTTCVATRLSAGHADNALPQTARATVNCRSLPGESPEKLYDTLLEVLKDERILIRPLDEARPSPASPLRADVMEPIRKIVDQMWPGIPIVPVMSTGATDAVYLRNAGIPTYGVSGLFSDVEDDRTHGKDERMGVPQFYEGREFLYRLVKAYSS